MRVHLSNAAYGLLDYAAYPAIMLVATPTLLHHLGLASYGIWLMANAAVGARSIVSSGFGDAVIQRVATLRATGDVDAIRKVIANMLAINLVLGGALAIVLWTLIPFLTGRITHFDPALRQSCLWSLRIGAVLILLKSIESVFLCAQRAHERYAPIVRISVATRVLAILLCVAFAVRGYGVPALMGATSASVIAGIVAQRAALRHLGSGLFLPEFDRAIYRDLASFGAFSWLQAVSGVLFSQADRLLLGVTLGASAVSYYGIAVQIAQPIHGLTAAGLHFLFPHLAMRFVSTDITHARRPVLLALSVNIAMAATLAALVILLGPPLLKHWIGAAFVSQSSALLPWLAAGFALLALNVTGHYTLLALGRVRLVTALNVIGGIAMLLAMTPLVRTFGVRGAALARLCYGPITCLFYIPLLRLFFRQAAATVRPEYVATEGT